MGRRRNSSARLGSPSPLSAAARVVAALALVVVALAGCTGATDPTPPPAPTTDDLARQSLARDAVLLLGLAERLGRAQPPLGSLTASLADTSRAHLAALGARIPAVTASTSPAGGATTAPTTPAASAVTPAKLQAEQWRAARSALALVGSDVSPGIALLSARIAAEDAADADLLARAARLPPQGDLTPLDAAPPATSPASDAGPSTSPSPSLLPGADEQALASLVAAEHAAVYAYGLIAARADDARRQAVLDVWNRHVVARDTLEQTMVDAGATPPAAQPAYDLSSVPTTPAAAIQLAAAVEDKVALVAAEAVSDLGRSRRALAADQLVLATRTSARWLGTGARSRPDVTADLPAIGESATP